MMAKSKRVHYSHKKATSMKFKTFEEFLQEKHATILEYALKDDLVEGDFDKWLETKDVNDIITYGEEYGREIQLR